MAEEHGCQSAPEHLLCANNCGFFGSPATMNFCSKCYRDFCQGSTVKSAVEQSLAGPSGLSGTVFRFAVEEAGSSSSKAKAVAEVVSVTTEVVVAEKNRCFLCRKKVGLATRFECKCGVTFCSMHRYPEKHDCEFDYKGVGKERIAKANPVVKGDKLYKV